MKKFLMLLVAVIMVEWIEAVPKLVYTPALEKGGKPIPTVNLVPEQRRTNLDKAGVVLTISSARKLAQELRKDPRNDQVRILKIEEIK